MAKPRAQSRPRSLLDISIAGRELTPGAKAAIRTLAAGAARLDSQRRALTGQAGPSPIALALVAAGAADARRPALRSTAVGRPSIPGPLSAIRATAGQFIDRKAQTVSDNLDDYGDRITRGVENGQNWLERAPGVVRDNLNSYLPGLDGYLDMVSKVDMQDVSMLTPRQVELREQAKLERPRPDYNTPYFQDIHRQVEGLNPVVRQVNAGVRGAADTASWGLANYAAAVGDTATNPYSYSQNLEGERYIDLLDSKEARAGQTVGRVAGSFLQPGGGYVAAAKTLPVAMARAAAVDGANGLVHDFVASPGDPEDRLESGVKGALREAMAAPLGPLAGHVVKEIAPLAARERPYLESILSTLATTAPKELAAAMAEMESRRPRAR